MAESSNKSHFMDLIVRRLYYFSIRLDYFFILLEVYGETAIKIAYSTQ